MNVEAIDGAIEECLRRMRELPNPADEPGLSQNERGRLAHQRNVYHQRATSLQVRRGRLVELDAKIAGVEKWRGQLAKARDALEAELEASDPGSLGGMEAAREERRRDRLVFSLQVIVQGPHPQDPRIPQECLDALNDAGAEVPHDAGPKMHFMGRRGLEVTEAHLADLREERQHVVKKIKGEIAALRLEREKVAV